MAPMATDRSSKQGRSLRFHLVVVMVLLTLGVELMLGITAVRLADGLGLSDGERTAFLIQVVAWSLGAVLLTGLAGVLLGRKLVEPISRLNGKLREGNLLEFRRDPAEFAEFSEVDQLAGTMDELASILRARDQELAASEEKFRETFDLVEIGLAHLDANGTFLRVNRRLVEMLGYGAADLIGKPFRTIFHPEERAILDSVPGAAAISGIAPGSREQRYVRKDGTTLWARRSTVFINDESSAAKYALTAIEDVSQYHANQETLRTLNESLRAIVENSPLAIYSITPGGIVTLWNPAAERLFDLKEADVLGRPSPLAMTDLEQTTLAIRKRVLSGETVHHVEIEHGTETRRTSISLSAAPLRSGDGKIIGVLVTCADITGLKTVERALEASEARFRALSESAMDIVTVVDAEGVILYQSPSVRHLLGVDPESMIGLNQFDIIHRDDSPAIRDRFKELITKGMLDRPVEFRVRHADGTWRTLESIGKNCLDVPAIRGIIVNTRDVSERRAIQQRIQHLAYHDALTSLPNRSLLQDRVAQAISRADRSGKRLAVMFIDIDNFKNINDTLGHDVGDELLREVARRLSASVRAHDTIARQGGDEFIVLLEELEGQAGAARVAQKILDALRSAFDLSGSNQHVSGSIGIALFPDDGKDSQTLMKNADTAMFHSKAQGKNTYHFFTSNMNIAVKRRAMLESSLRAAVKDGDFLLHYQPQVDLTTGRVVAVEALVRWNNQSGGIVMPGDFIPLAEETGLINEIGEWVMREGCMQARRWQAAGIAPERIAINLSARQLGDSGFLAMVQRVLSDTGLSPNCLELEITESQVMKQAEGSIQLLNELSGMGIHLAVDDFGTGYSSLSYLKRLPISKLKIDQSFVRDITVDPNDTAIVVAIISMARSLDLEIIAEGIETLGQLNLLRAKGCAIGQGYYFSMPLGESELEPVLRRGAIAAEAQFV
ncbi:MAG: EAL domain-containing protein [Burkholderiales bacterium]|nr:EAL domain-containing protein [Burkholderiales bacterium]